MDAVTTVEKTKKTPVLSGKEKRKLKRMIARKINKLEMISMEDVRLGKQALNEKLKRDIQKFIYEILTNIPKGTTEVTWTFKVDRNKKGIFLTYVQNSGTTLETVRSNQLTEDTISDNDHYNGKPKDSGSVFGTGLTTIDSYTTSFTFSCGLDGKWEQWNTKTNTVEDVVIAMPEGVILDMFIPYTNSMVGYYKFIERVRNMISLVDTLNMDYRTHTMRVSGLTNTENNELSLPIEPYVIKWKDSMGKSKTHPDSTFLLDDKNKQLSEIVLDCVGVRDKARKVKFKNFSIGRLDGLPEGWPQVADRPLLQVVCEESGQSLVFIGWKGSYPVSVNNCLIRTYVSKEDFRWFFTSSDKLENLYGPFEELLQVNMKMWLLKYYPDSKTLEVASQWWIRDVIVDDKLGKKFSDLFRNEFGLGFMNKMTVKQREKLVHMEWSKGSNRYDFLIWLAENAKVTSKTNRLIIECKRNGFTKANMNQLEDYLIKTANAVRVLGTSVNITSNQFTYWNESSSEINGSGMLSNHIEFDLIDLDEWGFANYLDEYHQRALDAIEKNKN